MSGIKGYSMLVPERASSRRMGDTQDEKSSEDDVADDSPTLYTVEDLMDIQDCCYNTARKTMAQDDFPSFKMNERWYVLEEDLVEYWRQQGANGGKQDDEVDALDVIS